MVAASVVPPGIDNTIDITGGNMEVQGAAGIYTLIGILIVIGVILFWIAKKVD